VPACSVAGQPGEVSCALPVEGNAAIDPPAQVAGDHLVEVPPDKADSSVVRRPGAPPHEPDGRSLPVAPQVEVDPVVGRHRPQGTPSNMMGPVMLEDLGHDFPGAESNPLRVLGY
jgi:hypothetical protein